MDANADALIARLRSQPDDLDAYESLKAHYHYAGDFASLANLVEGWAARAADPTIAADAFHEAARTVSYYLQDQERTLELLEHALDRVPDHAEASADLSALLEALADARHHVGSLERRAARLARAGADPVHVAAVHFQLGELLEKSFERPDQAVPHYRTAFELDPEHLPAMYATREIYRTSGDLRTAAQIYELEVRAERDDRRKVMLLRELSHLYREGLSDLEASVATLDRALEQEPRDTEIAYELAGALLARAAVRGETKDGIADRRHASALLVRLALAAEGETQVAFLEAALDAAPDSDEALTQLERVAPLARAEARLPLRWIRYVTAAPEGAHVTERRTKLADAYEAAGQPNDAIGCLEPLLERGDVGVIRRLADLYARVGRTDDAARTRTLALASMPEADRLRTLESSLAAAEPGSEAASALADQLLALSPDHAAARDARLAGFRKRGDHAALRDHFLAIADDASRSNEARADAFREVAALAEGPLADPALAVRARGELLRLSPGDRDARAKLKQTMRLGQQWNELAGILVWEATQETELDLRRNAALSLDELTERASLDPGRAIEGLVRAHADAPADTAIRDRLLARLLDAGRLRDALPLLEAKAVDAPTARDKASLYERAATIREGLGDLVGAVAALERWIEAEPASEPAHARALELTERTDDPALLARALERESARAQGDERARWLLRLAELRERRLGCLDGAIEALVQATESAANDERIRLELEASLTRAGRFDALRTSMRTRVARQPTDDARVTLLREIARLSESELGDAEGAAEAHRAIRAVREDAVSLGWLVERARGVGARDELITLLTARYELDPDPGRRANTALELAALLDRPDGDRARAKTLLESVRGLAPEPMPVLEHLARICEAEGDSAGLGSAWAALLDHVDDPKRAIDLARALHRLADETLKSEPLVAKALFHWSRHAPSERAPLEALVAMHVGAGRQREAADALLELGKRIDSPSESEAKLLEASERYEAASDLAAAIDATRLARNVGFGSERARERLGQVAEKAGRFDIVLELAEERVAQAARRPDAVGAYVDELLACASIARQRMNDATRAQAYLLRASEVAEADEALVSRVEAVAAEIDRAAEDTSAILERALVRRLLDRAAGQEGEARVASIERAARILVEAVGDLPAAYALLVAATEEDAAVALLERLVEVGVRAAMTSELDALLGKRFDDSIDADAARALLEMRAKLYERTGRAADEANVLQRLFTMRSSPENRDRLLDALGRAGRHQDRVNVLEQAIRRAPADSEERVALAKRVATVFEVDLANKFEATDAWRRVLRWAPNDAEAGDALARLGAKRPSPSIPPAAMPAKAPSLPPPATPAPAATKSPSLPPPAVPPAAKTPSLPPPEAAPRLPPPPPIAAPKLPALPPPPAPPARVGGAPMLAPPPPPRVPVVSAVATVTDDVVEDVTDADDDVIEELDEVDDAPRDAHVRPRVSLPPPPPTRKS